MTIEEAQVEVAQAHHEKYAQAICDLIENAAKIRGTGIAKRSEEYIKTKMREEKAVIALSPSGQLAGFCYIETWQHQAFVAHSGLIVHEDFRAQGLAKKIKSKAFELSRRKFPHAKIFGLTTSLAVMKINSELGYKPVTFSELTQEESFWKGCQSCVNYDVLSRTQKKHCLCTGMIYAPENSTVVNPEKPKRWPHPLKVYGRWVKYKQNILLKFKKKKD